MAEPNAEKKTDKTKEEDDTELMALLDSKISSTISIAKLQKIARWRLSFYHDLDPIIKDNGCSSSKFSDKIVPVHFGLFLMIKLPYL